MDEDSLICPKCSAENPIDSKYCKFCGRSLSKSGFKLSRNGKMILLGVILIATSLIFENVILKSFPSSTQKEAEVVNTLNSIANELNKNLPMTLDSETRLDNISVKPGKKLQYNLTLTNKLSNEIDIPFFRSAIESNMVNLMKTHPNLNWFRENDVIIVSFYKDKVGNYVDQIEITADEYK